MGSCESSEDKENLKISIGLWGKILGENKVLDPKSAFTDTIKDLLKVRRQVFRLNELVLPDGINPLWVSYMLGYGSVSMHYIPIISTTDMPDLVRLISSVLDEYKTRISRMGNYKKYYDYIDACYYWSSDDVLLIAKPEKVKAIHFIALWLQIFYDNKNLALMHIFDYLDKYLAEQFEKDGKPAADKVLDDRIE